MKSFDPTTHEYKDGEKLIPSVTQVMKGCGLSFGHYGNETAAAFGTAGHKIMQLLLSDQLGEYDPAFEPWMRGIRKFIAAEKPDPVALEQIIFSANTVQKFAGTIDFYGLFRGTHAILDWKFYAAKGKASVALAGVQLGGYSILACDHYALKKRPHCYMVQFFEDGYCVAPCNDASYDPIFRSCLNLYYFKRKFNFKERGEHDGIGA
jgi:hypothetical protein